MLVSEQGFNAQSALYTGLRGFNSGQQMQRQAGADIAQFSRNSGDMNRAAINLVTAQLQVNASAEVIQRAEGMIGTIIDTYA